MVQPPMGRKPPALTKCLLFPPVLATHNTNEHIGDEILYEADEGLLGEESTPGSYSGREHANHSFYDDQHAKKIPNRSYWSMKVVG